MDTPIVSHTEGSSAVAMVRIDRGYWSGTSMFIKSGMESPTARIYPRCQLTPKEVVYLEGCGMACIYLLEGFRDVSAARRVLVYELFPSLGIKMELRGLQLTTALYDCMEEKH